jgi:hypothetical protein
MHPTDDINQNSSLPPDISKRVFLPERKQRKKKTQNTNYHSPERTRGRSAITESTGGIQNSTDLMAGRDLTSTGSQQGRAKR